MTEFTDADYRKIVFRHGEHELRLDEAIILRQAVEGQLAGRAYRIITAGQRDEGYVVLRGGFMERKKYDVVAYVSENGVIIPAKWLDRPANTIRRPPLLGTWIALEPKP